MSVVVAHEVRRCPVPSPNLDDLGRLVGRTGRPAVHAQPVTYYCTHDNSSQGSYPAACTFPRIGGRWRRHRRGIDNRYAAVNVRLTGRGAGSGATTSGMSSPVCSADELLLITFCGYRTPVYVRLSR